jgi:signal peptidase I
MDIVAPASPQFPAYKPVVMPTSSLPTSSLPPSSSVSFQPGAPIQPGAAEVERIDETPQQNSSDIEGLITRQHRLKRLKGLASLLLFVGGVIVAAYLINNFVFQSYYVDGTSMTPTLQNDDRLIIDKVERTWATLQGRPYIPERGQIIVLDSSLVGIGGHEEQLIKRVIGLPGDTVIVKDGTVTIKNKSSPDGFDVGKQLGLNLKPTFSANTIEATIPDGEVYVMGDNRVENGSYDSRAFGPIESTKIVGRLWARILPLDKAQVF